MSWIRQENIGYATFDGVRGSVSKKTDRNLWWRVDLDSPSILFSLRRDGVWRMVGAPADGAGLQFH